MASSLSGSNRNLGEREENEVGLHNERYCLSAWHWLCALTLVGLLCGSGGVKAQVLGDPVDGSLDFQKMENAYFIGSRLVDFNSATGQGTLQWDRYVRSTTLSFNKMDVTFARGRSTEFPGTEYDQDSKLPSSARALSG